MAAEYRAEERILHPAYIKLLELRILWRRATSHGVVPVAEETSDVSIEVRTSCHCVVETGRELLAEHVPCRVHVSAPKSRTISLLACKGRTCHYEDSLFLRVCAEIVMDAAY